MMSLGTMLNARRLICAGIAGALAVAAVLVPAMAETPKRGGTLTVGLAQDPPIVDPIRTGSFTGTPVRDRHLRKPVRHRRERPTRTVPRRELHGVRRCEDLSGQAASQCEIP